MKTNEQIAREYFTSGYNCAQSVFLTYAEKYGFDKNTSLKLSSSFGGGMGRMREVCGAVSAMFMIAGLEKGYTQNNNDEKKAQHYELIQKLAQEFKKENGSIICRELLGVDADDNPIPSKRTEQYYQDRPCEEFIASACRIIDKNITAKMDIH